MTSFFLSLLRVSQQQVAEVSYITTSFVSYSVTLTLLVFVSGLDGER